MACRLIHASVLALLGGFIVPPVAGQVRAVPDVVKPAVEDRQRPLEPYQVRMAGLLGERTALGERNRLLTIDEDLLLDGFRKRPGEHPWIGEHAGKWLHAATLTWAATGNAMLREKLDRVAGGLIAAQSPDGYLGTYLDKDRWTSWDVWSHKYDLIGLLTYHRYTGHEPSLAACRKIGDLLCATFGREKRDLVKAGTHVGMAATSVLEPMVLLYRATGDKKYLDFCGYILWSWDQPHGPKILSTLREGKGVHQVANGKAYEMLSNLVGVCELYRTTGDRDLLPPVIHAWEDVVAKRLYISGSASQGEHFKEDHFLPNDDKPHIMETCVTTTWIQLCAQLLRLTGEPRFADELERTMYNQQLFAQRPDGGDFAYFNPLEGRRAWKPFGQREIHCCRSSGPRGLALAPTFLYGTDPDGAVVNSYEPGEARLDLAGGGHLRLEVQTRYPVEAAVRLIVHLDRPRSFALKLRVPPWSRRTEVQINGEAIPEQPDAGAYLLLRREWKEGDWIALHLDTRIRLVKGEPANPGKAALMKGPLVLALDDAPAVLTLNGSLPAETRPISSVSIDPAALNAGEGATLDTRPFVREWSSIYEVFACWPGGPSQPDATTRTSKVRLVPLAVSGADNSQYRVWIPLAKPDCGG
ncbi:MAG: hypothetical protein AMXMBFR83_29270 [Phycisphaerae bacterium]